MAGINPICRWRFPSIGTTLQMINLLPKFEQSEVDFRSQVDSHYDGTFLSTPYQYACQQGLYYLSNGYYFPKFNDVPNEQEIQEYLENWIVNYTVPNPYMNSMSREIQPFSIHEKLCQKMVYEGGEILWNETLQDIFDSILGNEDALKSAIKNFSPILDIVKNQDGISVITLKPNKSYEELNSYINLGLNLDNNDKEEFFDLFSLPKELNTLAHLHLEVSTEEISILSELDENDSISTTERIQIAKARIGQGKFRRLLIEEGACCLFTQVDDLNLLIASHIKPWTVANNSERLDPKNGLLLTPTYDKLFDKGFISFTENKELMISNKLDGNNISKLGLIPNNVVSNLNLEGREQYFAYHRREVFRS